MMLRVGRNSISIDILIIVSKLKFLQFVGYKVKFFVNISITEKKTIGIGGTAGRYNIQGRTCVRPLYVFSVSKLSYKTVNREQKKHRGMSSYGSIN
jgi:hypothetical protein